ncbi:Uncharacterized protein APZ42_022709 [Daphnia magna]|uniref:Uncharacterized protein n=1 Tax=Daphnia magna TaxID=35525 RepID=A0A164VR26_9CRUS|nr:Uncharacterized protein APZ42_022709 [Daphnia magna]
MFVQTRHVVNKPKAATETLYTLENQSRLRLACVSQILLAFFPFPVDDAPDERPAVRGNR